MKIKVGIVLTIILVLCLAGYLISAQTQIKSDLVEAPDNDSTQALPEEETGKTEETSQSETDAPDTNEGQEPPDEADGQDGQMEGEDLLTGTGKFMGRIDNNFIEMELEDGTLRSFQLSEAIKETFDDYGFETGDSVRFSYRERDGQNPIIEEIEKHIS